MGRRVGVHTTTKSSSSIIRRSSTSMLLLRRCYYRYTSHIIHMRAAAGQRVGVHTTTKSSSSLIRRSSTSMLLLHRCYYGSRAIILKLRNQRSSTTTSIDAKKGMFRSQRFLSSTTSINNNNKSIFRNQRSFSTTSSSVDELTRISIDNLGKIDDAKQVRNIALEHVRENRWTAEEIANSLKSDEKESHLLSIFLRSRRKWYSQIGRGSMKRWRTENEEIALKCTSPEILNYLNRMQKWVLLDTLYYTRNTMSRFVRSHCVSQVLLNTKNEDLTWLKLRIDSGREFQQQEQEKQEEDDHVFAKTWAQRLRRALFPSSTVSSNNKKRHRRVVNNFDLQYVVLKDLVREHQIEVLQHFALSASDSVKDTPMIKVLSDIDDTVVAGFKDRRIPSSTLYPGAISFLTSLMHCSNESRKLSQNNLPVAFLTARPSGFRQSLAGYTRSQIRKQTKGSAMDSGGVTVLAGSVSTGLNHSRIAKMKLRNFILHKSMYPEMMFLFVGDNGQGDKILAQDMIEKYPNHVRGAFIHRIEDKGETEDEGIFMFRTYAEATRIAYEMNLLSKEFALSVLSDCESEMGLMLKSFSSNDGIEKNDTSSRLDYYSEILSQDIELARDVIASTSL